MDRKIKNRIINCSSAFALVNIFLFGICTSALIWNSITNNSVLLFALGLVAAGMTAWAIVILAYLDKLLGWAKQSAKTKPKLASVKAEVVKKTSSKTKTKGKNNGKQNNNN